MPASFILLRVSVSAGRLPGHVQAAFGGHFLPPFGHQADDVRLELERDGDDLRRVGHFQVEPGLDDLAQLPDVAVLHVPPVFAQMGGDPVRARGLAGQRGRHRVRFAAFAPAVTGFAQRGDVVNVDTQLQHAPGLSVTIRVMRNPNCGPAVRPNDNWRCLSLASPVFMRRAEIALLYQLLGAGSPLDGADLLRFWRFGVILTLIAHHRTDRALALSPVLR